MALKGKKTAYGLLTAGILGAVAFALLLVLFFTVFKTTTYYVVNTDIPARTKISAEMLSPASAYDGSAPATAWTKEQLNSRAVFSKIDLHKGEPLTVSNSGDLDPVNKNIPANFTVASISLPPVNANLGAIRAGDHINIYRVTKSQTGSDIPEANLVMQNVMVVNAGSSVETANVKTDKNGGETKKSMVNTVYQVAVSPENAANLAVLASESSTLYVTPTPATGIIDQPIQSTINALTLGVAPDASEGAQQPAKKKVATKEAPGAENGDNAQPTEETNNTSNESTGEGE